MGAKRRGYEKNRRDLKKTYLCTLKRMLWGGEGSTNLEKTVQQREEKALCIGDRSWQTGSEKTMPRGI